MNRRIDNFKENHVKRIRYACQDIALLFFYFEQINSKNFKMYIKGISYFFQKLYTRSHLRFNYVKKLI